MTTNYNPQVDTNTAAIAAGAAHDATQDAALADHEARISALEGCDPPPIDPPPIDPPPTEPPPDVPPEHQPDPPGWEAPPPLPEHPSHAVPAQGVGDRPHPDRHPLFMTLSELSDCIYHESFRPHTSDAAYVDSYYARLRPGGPGKYAGAPMAYYDRHLECLRKLTLKYSPGHEGDEDYRLKALHVRDQSQLLFPPTGPFNADSLTLVYEIRPTPVGFNGGKVFQTASHGNGKAAGRIAFEHTVIGPAVEGPEHSGYSYTPDPKFKPDRAVNINREFARPLGWRVYKTTMENGGFVGGSGSITPITLHRQGNAGASQPNFSHKMGGRYAWDDHGINGFLLRSDMWCRVWQINRWDTTPHSIEVWYEDPYIGAMLVGGIDNAPFPLQWQTPGWPDAPDRQLSDRTMCAFWIELNNSSTLTPHDSGMGVRNFTALRGTHRPADYNVSVRAVNTPLLQPIDWLDLEDRGADL